MAKVRGRADHWYVPFRNQPFVANHFSFGSSRHKKAPTGQGEGLGQGLLNATSLVESEARVCPAGRSKAINIAAIVAQEVFDCLAVGALIYCVANVLL